MKTCNMFLKYGSTALALVVISTASQAAIDVSGVVTEISGTLAPIGLIGAGVLLVMVSIKAFKWVRSAM